MHQSRWWRVFLWILKDSECIGFETRKATVPMFSVYEQWYSQWYSQITKNSNIPESKENERLRSGKRMVGVVSAFGLDDYYANKWMDEA